MPNKKAHNLSQKIPRTKKEKKTKQANPTNKIINRELTKISRVGNGEIVNSTTYLPQLGINF
jgi:hypothetical protein